MLILMRSTGLFRLSARYSRRNSCPIERAQWLHVHLRPLANASAPPGDEPGLAARAGWLRGAAAFSMVFATLSLTTWAWKRRESAGLWSDGTLIPARRKVAGMSFAAPW